MTWLSNVRKRLAARVDSLPVRHPPAPWRPAAVHAVGGLTSVGFSDDGSHLLVTSSQGRGVYDCATGVRVARDPTPDAGHHADPLLWDGIGPIAGRVVHTAGLWGGGLHAAAPDGWRVDVVWPDWPEATVLVESPGASWSAEPSRGDVFRLPNFESPRAAGFSVSGGTLVIAESHTLTIYSRI